MAKTIFEQTGGTYTMRDDYCLPNLTLPPEEERPIGVQRQHRLHYLKPHHKILFCDLLTSGKFHSHLADVEEKAQSIFLRLVKEQAEREDVTEQLKFTDKMAWMQNLSSMRSRATEIVNLEVVFV